MSKQVSICVIGSGYVGLVAAVCFAEMGHQVTCVDNDEARVKLLCEGGVPIYESHLPELLAKHRGSRVEFTSDLATAVTRSEAIFIAVGTPQGDTGAADLSYVEAVVSAISRSMTDYKVIVEKSTVPVYTNEWIVRVLHRYGVDSACFDVVSNPEFLREGTAVADSLNPDRIVVGSHNRQAAAQVADLFGDSGAPVVITDATTAELIKYASNAFLATKLTFINSMAGLCEAAGADVTDLVLGIGHDKRIGFEFLQPGPGWGGSCLPKDTCALVNIAMSLDLDMKIVRAAISGNDDQMERVIEKIKTAAGGTLEGRSIGVLGLSFKANTGDRRNSPAILITQRLVDQGATVRAFDPTVNRGDAEAPDLLHLTVCESPYEAVDGTHAIALLTEWQEFLWLDFARIREQVANPAIVDARNLWESGPLHHLGFSYSGIGR